LKVFTFILLILTASTICAQEDAINLAISFSNHVVKNDIEDAESLCSEFGRENYFENRKHIKYCRFEFFNNAHNFEVAEKRGNEVRIKFNSGRDSLVREVYARKFKTGWKMITKIELVDIKNYYLTVELDSSTVHRGWNTLGARKVDLPFKLHLLANTEDLYILGLELREEVQQSIIENRSIIGDTMAIVLIQGNIMPLVIGNNSHGSAVIMEVLHDPKAVAMNTYVIEGKFTTNGGKSGNFRMKTILNE
jgi:hypothetical protein